MSWPRRVKDAIKKSDADPEEDAAQRAPFLEIGDAIGKGAIYLSLHPDEGMHCLLP